MYISVIVPAYKQEATITQDIASIYQALILLNLEFEILVVVDGFADNTFFVAKKMENDRVKVLGYEKNRGKGYAVKYGISQSLGEHILFIDGGMDISPKSISMLVEHMKWYDADVVVGSKRHPVSQVSYPLLRRTYSWFYYTLVRMLFGLKVTDTQTGIKIFKREVIKAILPRLLIKEFAFDIELLAVSKYLGYDRIYEAPVELSLGFDSTTFSKRILFDPFIKKMLIDTLAVFYRLRILDYYDDENRKNWERQHELAAHGIYEQRLKDYKPMFSIVIPVRSVNAYLRENIYYLKRLDYPNFEVIVVLDEEEDTSFVDDDRFRFMISGPLGPGEKRNLGVYAADGEIIAFLDDDAFPSNDWLTKAAAIFENSNIYALGAPAVTPKNAQFLERVSGKVLESVLVSGNTVYRHRKVRRRLIDDYPTVNLFVRREDFIEVGGFVEEFWPGEDTKLCLDLVESKGKKFVYDPRPVVYHHRRNVFLPHLKQISRYGQHRGQFAKIFPKTSRLISYFIPSLFALGVIIGPVVCLLYPNLWSFYFGVIGFYAFLVVWSALKVFFESWNVFEGLFVLLGIVATHFVYGINFMIGFIRRPKLKLRAVDQTSGSYVGG